MTRAAAYERAIRDPNKTDDEKWALTVKGITEGAPIVGGVDWPAEKQIRYVLKRPLRTTDLWLTYYPNIVVRLSWEAKDLREIGELIGWPGRFRWDEDVGGGVRVYRSAKFCGDDIARMLLPRLTGIEFRDKEAFMRWLEKNEKYLKWDKALGKFVVQAPNEKQGDSK